MANKRILSKNVFSFQVLHSLAFSPRLRAVPRSPICPCLALRVMAKFGWVHDNTGSRDVFPISIPPQTGARAMGTSFTEGKPAKAA